MGKASCNSHFRRRFKGRAQQGERESTLGLIREMLYRNPAKKVIHPGRARVARRGSQAGEEAFVFLFSLGGWITDLSGEDVITGNQGLDLPLSSDSGYTVGTQMKAVGGSRVVRHFFRSPASRGIIYDQRDATGPRLVERSEIRP